MSPLAIDIIAHSCYYPMLQGDKHTESRVAQPPVTKEQKAGPQAIKSANALKVAFTDDMVRRTKSFGYLSELLHTMLTDKNQASYTFFKLTENSIQADLHTIY
jgi:hypothetical protein